MRITAIALPLTPTNVPHTVYLPRVARLNSDLHGSSATVPGSGRYSNWTSLTLSVPSAAGVKMTTAFVSGQSSLAASNVRLM